MDTVVIDVKRTRPDDWETYKNLRIQALQTDPEAFGGTLEQAVNRADDEWRERSQNTVLGSLNGEVQGVASWIINDRDELQLVGMWVSETARGSGLADALVQHVLDNVPRGTSYGGNVSLYVYENNMRAKMFYEKMGFVVDTRHDEWGDKPLLRMVYHGRGF